MFAKHSITFQTFRTPLYDFENSRLKNAKNNNNNKKHNNNNNNNKNNKVILRTAFSRLKTSLLLVWKGGPKLYDLPLGYTTKRIIIYFNHVPAGHYMHFSSQSVCEKNILLHTHCSDETKKKKKIFKGKKKKERWLA